MFQTFSGQSRRPRQVNLSGRNVNPFGIVQSTSSTIPPQGSAVQNAQQERKARQQERERLQASRIIQKSWREHITRKRLHQRQRDDWDILIGQHDVPILIIIKDLLQFVRPMQEPTDSERVLKACRIFLQTSQPQYDMFDNINIQITATFAEKVLDMLGRTAEHGEMDQASTAISTLQGLCDTNANPVASRSTQIIPMLAQLLKKNLADALRSSAFTLVKSILERSTYTKAVAHEGLVTLLKYDWLADVFSLGELAKAIHPGSLAIAMQNHMKTQKSENREESCWMLAHYIYLHRTSTTSEGDVTNAGQVVAHIRSLTQLMSRMTRDHQHESSHDSTSQSHRFVQEQLNTLVDKATISSLLTHFEVSASNSLQSDYASTLASYVLTLIQMFPRRNDEIRMWIYLGSANTKVNGQLESLPAIQFFWQAVAETVIFTQISEDSKATVKLLAAKNRSSLSNQQRAVSEQEWKLVLLFLELYTFVLKVMDDDEFVSGGAINSDPSYQTWTRRGALRLTDISRLTIFLKNLAFAMYWNAADITSIEQVDQSRGLSQYFSANPTVPTHSSRVHSEDHLVVRGVQSSAISYIKGTVTGLLRMLYERDSRRKFLPEGHWLMPQVEMAGFIQAVLEEQRHKNEQNEQQSDEEDSMDIDEYEDDDRDLMSLVGTQRTQHIRRLEQIRKEQQRVMKRRRLEETLPRLNILENMPFFIPFHTRVQIFRAFVRQDQVFRRNGYIDPDSWRMAMMSGLHGDTQSREQQVRSRSARVRREHVMEDAFDQLFELGEGLKEPIQITFFDKFNEPEAGIDGGGVTKEFLMSVTEEAFKKGELKLFKESDQHLLYPNPALIEEEKLLLRADGIKENSKKWLNSIKDITSKYEFVGRIVGKCLYEGILIDVNFAPFFLVKWALTGGSNSATNESGYRATINDLRALDEDLYKGLLDLKNYNGNAEDFSLDFTITDQISSEDEPMGEVNVTRELRPNGANVPVTNENKLVYISYVARHRLQIQPYQQTNAFLRGLGNMISPSWLSMFNQSELQTLIGGDSSEIDVADLRRNTLYGGVYQIGDDGQEHPTIQMFWDVVQEISDTDRRKLLKYVTSTPRAPLLGFNQLRPAFSIRDSGSDQQRLPSTSTCVNLLKLPIYHKKEILKAKLLYAVTSGAGFDLS